MTATLKSLFLIPMALIGVIFSIQLACAGTVTICDQYDTVNITPNSKLYVVQNCIWNGVDGSQCIKVSDTTGNFSITSAKHKKPLDGSPAAYPSTFKGCHWGDCTKNSGMPIKLSSILHANSGWSTVQPSSGVYNTTYDIWFNKTSTASGQPNGAEVMIWLNHQGGIQPEGSLIVPAVSIAGAKWDVWVGSHNGVKVISYVRTVGVTSVASLNLKSFFTDAKNRGYLRSNWYLISVEAGFEVWKGGTGLASRGFWVLVE